MRNLLFAVAILLAPSVAFAEDPSPTVTLCRNSLPCLQQMVDDLRQHRQYLEDQLSLAKSLLQEANQRIVQQLEQLKALSVPPETGEKPKLDPKP